MAINSCPISCSVNVSYILIKYVRFARILDFPMVVSFICYQLLDCKHTHVRWAFPSIQSEFIMLNLIVMFMDEN